MSSSGDGSATAHIQLTAAGESYALVAGHEGSCGCSRSHP